jgi:hypothetical protein
MSYVGSADAQRANLVSASLVNKAGRTVTPTLNRYPTMPSPFLHAEANMI